ncbi:MAG: helix-hairpin-helix domain-containing protein, partial [Candidatus Omnitrophota bacterium]|nr:helix-hairpin-helix domain-containing protein [Candidatus Omnitrophota bacterium]
ADLFKLKNETFLLECLRKRIVYGIKEELLELVDLRGVGRVRARNLYKKGIHKISDLKYVDTATLTKIDQIGPVLAKDIKGQVMEPHVHARGTKAFLRDSFPR